MTWLTNKADLLEMAILNKDEVIDLRNKLIIYESLIAQKVKSYEMLVGNSKKLKLHIESILQSK